jgi:hypothetical protein
MARARRDRGRGRLSSIDLLPDEAEKDVLWAVDELRKRERLQKDILLEFNARLADRGIGPVSASAFNRFAVRKAAAFRRLDEVREISTALTKALGPDSADDLTMMVGETIKTLVFEILEGEDGISTKGAMELARALKHAVEAQSISTDHRRRIEDEFAKRTAKAIDAAGKEKGLSAKTRDAIKREILGIRAEPPR